MGVLTNPQISPREGGGVQRWLWWNRSWNKKRRSYHMWFPLLFTLKIYERPYRSVTIAYGVVFGTETEINQTLVHHCHQNIYNKWLLHGGPLWYGGTPPPKKLISVLDWRSTLRFRVVRWDFFKASSTY